MAVAPPTKTIVVIGAAGAQGGGVVRALSAKGGFAIKAVTRNPSSDKAKALAALPGVSVISVSLPTASIPHPHVGTDAEKRERAENPVTGVLCRQREY